MDLNDIAGYVFVLLLVSIVFGSILVFPIMRKLAALMEQKLQNRLPDDVMVRELRNVGAALQTMQHQIAQLSERQARIEAQLPDADRLKLPVGSGKD
jgi:Tfp pilus assembly protein PilO